MNDYSDTWWTQYIDKQPNKCCNCKFADYYPAHWWYPHFDPMCSKRKIHCQPDQDACSDFQLMGRLCR